MNNRWKICLVFTPTLRRSDIRLFSVPMLASKQRTMISKLRISVNKLSVGKVRETVTRESKNPTIDNRSVLITTDYVWEIIEESFRCEKWC